MKTSWDNAGVPYAMDRTKFEGFVYKITEIDTGKFYIGIKKFWSNKTLKPLKGKKNKRHTRVESDWMYYNSSNKELQKKINKNPYNYKKEILHLCETVTKMKSLETYLQLKEYLFGDWKNMYNEMINLRVRIRK